MLRMLDLDADLGPSRPQPALVASGEKCLHLICEYIRACDKKEYYTILGFDSIYDSAATLSRLSRTCRAMYVIVRNLPSVLEHARPRLSYLSLSRGVPVSNFAYWSDLAGIVWSVSDVQQLLELVSDSGAKTEHGCSSDKGDSDAAVGVSQPQCSAPSSLASVPTPSAVLGQLFISIRSMYWDRRILRGMKKELVVKILQVLQGCGGLSLSFSMPCPTTTLGFDLSKCTSLRFLDAHINVREDRAGFDTLVSQLSTCEASQHPHYASLSIYGDNDGYVTDLGPFHHFQDISFYEVANACSLQLPRGTRSVLLNNGHLSPEIIPDLSMLSHLHTVTLNLCDVTDVSMLCRVHTVDIIDNIAITDVRPLKSVHTLAFHTCPSLKDVSSLGTVHTLSLQSCDAVEDVSALGTVHTLTLEECAAVSDVSALGAVHTLKLTACALVSDVSALGRVHNLNVATCEAISDVSALGSVHTLNLSRCSLVSDVSALGSVHKLSLTSCTRITDVSALGNVYSLGLGGCRAITDVSALGTVHTLSLNFCYGVSDVSSLGGVHTLNLSGCPFKTGLENLGGVHYLDLSYCHAVTDVSALGNVHRLNLSSCTGISDVHALGNVHTLDLSDCTVSGVSALGAVHTLNLSGCGGLTDVSPLNTVKRIILHGCANVKGIAALKGKVLLMLADSS